MTELRERMRDSTGFLCAVEVVSTRGTVAEERAVRVLNLVRDMMEVPQLDWMSITDNAGGNPMLKPLTLGRPILAGGKQVVIHLSCKDLNRNGLESEAWQLASEGFDNVLALSGDYPVEGHGGLAKPVFDIDSVGLLAVLSEMNRGLGVQRRNGPPQAATRRLSRTRFFLGCVAANSKLHENEVVPQLLKLEKKLQAGAQFVVGQIGYDSRKQHELKAFLDRIGRSDVPLIGAVHVLTPPLARFFNQGLVPGVVVSDDLLAECERQGASPDRGRAFFLELAAKQAAIYRGLGYRGVYFGGLQAAKELETVMSQAACFGEGAWKQLAQEVRFGRPGEFYYFAQDPDTGLADPSRLSPEHEASLRGRKATRNVTLTYGLSKWTHKVAFTPGKGLSGLLGRIYASSAIPDQGPRLLRQLERVSKAVLFDCRDCGDCSLPDVAFLCPESQCAKNQRNGPCGGTRDGRCEVGDLECIWARAYDRLRYEGRERELLEHAPVVQDQGLRGTSSWSNAILRKDHHGRVTKPEPE